MTLRMIKSRKVHKAVPVGRMITFEDERGREFTGVLAARYNDRGRPSKTGKHLIVEVGGRQMQAELDHVTYVHSVRGRTPQLSPAVPRAITAELGKRPLYFAYGSNMDEAQMKTRVPGSKLLGAAWLHGYEFLFSGYSTTWGGSVANVRKKKGSKVFGVVYALPSGGLSTLSRFEGPRYTLKHELVKTVATKTPVSVSLYYQRQTAADAPPSPAYTQLILKALRRHGAP